MCKGLPLQDIASFLSFLFFFSFFFHCLLARLIRSVFLRFFFLYANISLSLSPTIIIFVASFFFTFFSLQACEMVQISPTTTSTHLFYGISPFWLIFILFLQSQFFFVTYTRNFYSLSLSHSLTSILQLSSLLLLLMLMTIAKDLFYAFSLPMLDVGENFSLSLSFTRFFSLFRYLYLIL